MIQKKALTLFTVTLLCLGAQPLLNAVPFSVDYVDGIFSDATVSGYGSVGGIGTNQISWGDPANEQNQQSGYLFEAMDPSSISANIGDTFSIGEFSHLNFPITDFSISAAQLDVTMNVNIDGVAFNNLLFDVGLTHEETPNNGEHPDDIVSIDTMFPSNLLTVNGQDYLITVSGFFVGQQLVSTFDTQENAITTVYLAATIQNVTVPEPSTYLILGTTLAVAFWAKRPREGRGAARLQYKARTRCIHWVVRESAKLTS